MGSGAGIRISPCSRSEPWPPSRPRAAACFTAQEAGPSRDEARGVSVGAACTASWLWTMPLPEGGVGAGEKVVLLLARDVPPETQAGGSTYCLGALWVGVSLLLRGDPDLRQRGGAAFICKVAACWVPH